MKKNIVMFAFFCLLSLIDYLSTLLVIGKGGQEINPVAAIAFHSSNPALYGSLFKILTIILVLVIWYIMKRLNKKDSFIRIITLVNAALILVILNNLYWGIIYL